MARRLFAHLDATDEFPRHNVNVWPVDGVWKSSVRHFTVTSDGSSTKPTYIGALPSLNFA